MISSLAWKRIRSLGSLLVVILILIEFWLYGLKNDHLTEKVKRIHSGSEVSSGGNRVIGSYAQAKKYAFSVSYWHPFTFYCDCSFDKQGILFQGCLYKPRAGISERAYRLEWEHIVPASLFGRKFKEWHQGHELCVRPDGSRYFGRACVRKVSGQFRLMESDLYNLVPSIGEVNRIRGNLPFVERSGNSPMNVCNLSIGRRTIVPPQRLKGFIARTYLYMNESYPEFGLLSPHETDRYYHWHQAFSPTDHEILRAREIARIQKNKNAFVL